MKSLREKMVDFKAFGTVLLTVGVLFFIGVIIPFAKSELDLNIMIVASLAFLAGSVLFFTFSKECEMKLLEIEEGEQSS